VCKSVCQLVECVSCGNSSAKSSLFARPGGGGESAAAAAAAAAKLWARIWRDFFSTAFTSDDDDGQMKKTIADRQTHRHV
jgi:hypothetical protein